MAMNDFYRVIRFRVKDRTRTVEATGLPWRKAEALRESLRKEERKTPQGFQFLIELDGGQ